MVISALKSFCDIWSILHIRSIFRYSKYCLFTSLIIWSISVCCYRSFAVFLRHCYYCRFVSLLLNNNNNNKFFFYFVHRLLLLDNASAMCRRGIFMLLWHFKNLYTHFVLFYFYFLIWMKLTKKLLLDLYIFLYGKQTKSKCVCLYVCLFVFFLSVCW